MQRLDSLAALQAWREERAPIALVPTMGALHEGHLSLIRAARAYGERVLVSIFVNPLQFNQADDLAAYPRDLEGDLAAAARAGADAVFCPSVEDLYPPGSETRVRVGALAEPLCGADRPGHFEGVCTVVLKLLMVSGCRAALFGEKDFQQLAIIRRMALDLSLPVEIVGIPTVREADGLAMSSRNQRLRPADRSAAATIPSALSEVGRAWAAGERQRAALEALFRAALAPELEVIYGELRDPESLQRSPEQLTGSALFAVAVRAGSVRLIDNLLLSERAGGA